MSWNVAMSKDVWGFSEIFFISLPKSPGHLTYVFIISHKLPTLVPIDSPTLFLHRVFILWFDQYIFILLFPLKCVWIPYLLHMFLILSISPCVYGMTMCPLLHLSLVESLPSGFPLVLSVLPTVCPLWVISLATVFLIVTGKSFYFI